jgi:streptomycin 3"-adenylyltransferase
MADDSIELIHPEELGSPNWLPSDVEQYLTLIGDRLASRLGENLVGSYLHGSAVLGGFNPDRSDLDVLVVVRNPLSKEEKRELGEHLLSDAGHVPADTLELSVVTESTARRVSSSPPYELHVNSRDRRWADGLGRSDRDLILHLPIVRQAGRPLGAGPLPAEVVGPVPRNLVLQEMRHELVDAQVGTAVKPEYLVLNACRNLAYLREDKFFSKIEGGRWALEHDTDLPPLIVKAAIRRQERSDPKAALSHEDGARVAQQVADQLGIELKDD